MNNERTNIYNLKIKWSLALSSIDPLTGEEVCRDIADGTQEDDHYQWKFFGPAVITAIALGKEGGECSAVLRVQVEGLPGNVSEDDIEDYHANVRSIFDRSMEFQQKLNELLHS